MKYESVRLAYEFAKEIRAFIPKSINEAIRRNRAEEDKKICHTHDFCDANEAMLSAWDETQRHISLETFLGPDDEHPDEELVEIWNDAWALARRQEFDRAALFRDMERCCCAFLGEPVKLKASQCQVWDTSPAAHVVEFWVFRPDKTASADAVGLDSGRTDIDPYNEGFVIEVWGERPAYTAMGKPVAAVPGTHYYTIICRDEYESADLPTIMVKGGEGYSHLNGGDIPVVLSGDEVAHSRSDEA